MNDYISRMILITAYHSLQNNTIKAVEDPSRDFFDSVKWSIQYINRNIFSALIAKAKLYAQHQ